MTVQVARVVINGRFLTQAQTGVQRYAVETLRALDRLLDSNPEGAKGLNVVLALPDGASPPGLKHISSAQVSGLSGHAWEQWSLPRFAKSAFVVNFNYSGPLFKRRQLVTIHDATVRAMPSAFKRSYRWWHNVVVSLLGRRADAVMTISEFSRDEIKRWFRLGRTDIVVGREGAGHVLVSASDDQDVLERHGLSSHGYVLGVGSVKPNKNFGLIGQARQMLPSDALPVAVAGARGIEIFGDDSQSIDAAGFRFLGFVPDDDLPALYRHAACFVFPSTYEGFGLPAIEAMAHDCPVLAARAASIPEVCGDAALYFDPYDAASLASAMTRVANDTALRARLVAAGRIRLERYTWEANARILLDVLLAHSGPRSTQRGATMLPATSTDHAS